ncbi:type I restriction-modification system subunit M [Opitutales bacterium ASA1]|uniref:type I restriction-modification system subunit M n=1 Tax=Congregicoccus parvus TaxID=3081749 RepID=UPI002B2BD220|nr:type I restriction-modification system subunit M [Opitutales bacterium ASA1]
MPSSDQIRQEEINALAWKACDTFRGVVDPSEYKNYILTMLFLKYLTDVWLEHYENLKKKFGDDGALIKRKLDRERFILPSGQDYYSLYAARERPNIGELINIALEKIEDANKTKLAGIFRNIDFNSEAALGQTKDRNRRLKMLLEDFHDERLNLRPSRIGKLDIIGNTYEYLIGRFAADSGKKGGEFYTPPEVAELLAKLVHPKEGDRICDPACGSGSLLIRVAKQISSGNFALYGQESNGSTWALARMNMALHGIDSARVEWGDTLNNPLLIENDALMRFDVVVANPPFSLDKWGQENALKDPHNRFKRGIPPKSRGDYAFISHMVHVAREGTGRVGVIAPHGVLFRGGQEGVIRQALIDENVLDAVIGLPERLFYGTGIPAAILLFKKGRKTKDVLFIDASREYQEGTNQNSLRASDVEKIVATHAAFRSVKKYAYRATPEELRDNEFNLNISRYVETQEPEPEVDLAAVRRRIEDLEEQLAENRKQMHQHLKELGLT